MSRSYRKPWIVDGYGTKHKVAEKRIANRTVRNTKDIASGKAYRKVYNPWNISDYKFDASNWPDSHKWRRK